MFPFAQLPEPPSGSSPLDVVTWLLGVALVLAGAYATWRNALSSNRKTESEGSISLLQEYRESLEDERDQRKTAERLMMTRIARIEARERVRDDYISLLRRHIEDGNPPPPPPWPDILRQPLSDVD